MTAALRILLVEDNDFNRDMLSRRLVRAGYEVMTATDGQDALTRMQTERPDVVLMDMSLPVMDGWTAARLAKSSDATRPIPIIALTAHAMETDRLNALAAGCDDYATKPVNFPALLDKINQLGQR